MKIGIISNKENIDSILNYINHVFKVTIYKNDDSEYANHYKYTCSNQNLKIIPIDSKDVSILLNNNLIDGIITHDYTIEHNNVDMKKINITHRGTDVNICAITKEDVNLDLLKTINKERQLRIMTEYTELALMWAKKYNFSIVPIHSSGLLESYITNDLADVCIMAADSGRTMRENNLKILDIISGTCMHLFISSISMFKFTEFNK